MILGVYVTATNNFELIQLNININKLNCFTFSVHNLFTLVKIILLNGVFL